MKQIIFVTQGVKIIIHICIHSISLLQIIFIFVFVHQTNYLSHSETEPFAVFWNAIYRLVKPKISFITVDQRQPDILMWPGPLAASREALIYIWKLVWLKKVTETWWENRRRKRTAAYTHQGLIINTYVKDPRSKKVFPWMLHSGTVWIGRLAEQKSLSPRHCIFN